LLNARRFYRGSKESIADGTKMGYARLQAPSRRVNCSKLFVKFDGTFFKHNKKIMDVAEMA